MRASLVTVMAVLSLTSCQSYPSGGGRPSPTGYWFHAYDIVGGGAREAAEVKHMLRTIAIQTNLPKRSPAPSDYSPVPFALYGDSRVRLLASRDTHSVHVRVIRNDYSGTATFARLDELVRITLSRRYQSRLYIEPEADLSHPIITHR
jgi:hypothetical protein